MNYLFTLLLWALLLIGSSAFAQTPSWQSAAASSQAGGSYSVANATAVDANGNIYILGTFTGTVSFGTTTLASTTTSIFVTKWSTSSSSFVWAQQAGSVGYDYAKAIAVNGNNIYITGYFTGPVATFGSITLNNYLAYSGSDIYVAKLIDMGITSSFVWVQQAGGRGLDYANGIAVSGNNVYITGQLLGASAAFGSITVVPVSSIKYSMYVAKIVDSGNTSSFVWTKTAGGSATDCNASGIVANGTTLYIIGLFEGASTSFDAIALTGRSMYVAKLTDQGNTSAFTWVDGTAGAASANRGGATAYALAVTGSQVYVAGSFSGTVTFGNSVLVNSSGITGSDAFIAKLTDAGSSSNGYTWAQRAGGPTYDDANAITVQGNNVYVCGSFSGATASFGAINSTSAGSLDAYVVKLTDAGNSSTYDWVKRAGGVDSDIAYAVVLSGSKVYVAGSARGTANFDNLTLNGPVTTPPGTPFCFLASIADPTLTATTAVLRPESIGLFPNPAHGRATVQLPAGAGPAALTVLDALGRPVRTQIATASKADLDLTGLAPGLYAVRVQAGGTTATRRLVVE